MKTIKLLLLFFILLSVELIFSQNRVTYSPSTITVSAQSNEEIVVPINAYCTGTFQGGTPVEPLICYESIGWVGTDFTNGVTHLYDGGATTIKFRFKLQVSTDRTVEYIFYGHQGSNSSCEDYVLRINVNYKAPSCSLPAPISVNVPSPSTNSAYCSWSDVSGAVSYDLKIENVSTGAITWENSVQNSKVITGLYPGTNYKVSVRAKCLNGLSSNNFSTPVLFRTICPTYTVAPTNVSAIPSGSMYKINFTSIPNYTGYYVLDYIDLINNSTGSQTLNSGDYFYYVSAPNSFKFKIRPVGCPAPASDWVTVVPTACPANNFPSNLAFYPVCGSTPSRCCGYGGFKWNAVSGAVRYKVEYMGINLTNPVQSVTGSFETTSINTNQPTLYACSSSQTGTWIIKFKVQSKCSNGTWSEYSPWSANFAW